MGWEEMSWDKVRRAQMRWSVECEGCSVKCGAWRVQCEVWSVKCEVWTVKCEVWSVKCEVWTVKCEVCTVKCEVWTVKCEVWSLQWEACSVKCGVWSLKCGVWSVKCEVELQMWHVKQDATFAECTHARAWLAHGACKFYRWERSYIYISFKATSAPPRAGTTGRRKFRSQTSDNMDRWKAEQGRGREKRKIRRKKIRRERVRRKKMQMCEKVGKSRNTVFFQWFGAPEGRKVGSLKRRVRSQLARWEMKKCTPLWREAHLEVKMYKTHRSWDVEKVHAVVARSTFWSQNVQNTPGSDHFWKLRCRKSARRCGAKHISKSKCTKHTILGPLLEVEMSKKCTLLWCEAHFQVKSVKNWRSRTTFGGSDVEKVSKKCTPLWREAHFEVKSVKTEGFEPFLTWRCRKSRHWLT